MSKDCEKCGQEIPFKLEHDMIAYDYQPGYGSPSETLVCLIKAVREIQEWIYAQENK